MRTRAVRAAAQLLVELAGEGAPGEPVEATVSDGEIEVRVVVVQAGKGGRSPAGDGQQNGGRGAGPHLTRLDRGILDAATKEYRSKAELAAACDGHDVDSYFETRVRRLRKLGLLETDGEGGYRLP